MRFNEAVEKIMLYVENSSKELFMLFRDADGRWHCDIMMNPARERYDWVDDVKDPFAITFTGADFSRGSYPYVYDKIFVERLRAEYNNADFLNADPKELNALINLVEENMGEFSHETVDYFTLYDRPLIALYNMNTISLVSNDPYLEYNPEKIGDFVKSIEDKVQSLINKRKAVEIPTEIFDEPPQELHPEKTDTPVPEPPGSNGYTALNKISVNSSEVILYENPDAEYRYMLVENYYTPYYNESGDNNIFTGLTDDYLEALSAFISRAQHHVICAQANRAAELNTNSIQHNELKSFACLPGSQDEDFTGKLLIVNGDKLKPEYRTPGHQLIVCSHGNGAKPDAKGTTVFGTELYSGKSICYGRDDILGVANPDRLPEKAMDKLAEYKKVTKQKQRVEPVKNSSVKAPEPKSTLQQKMKKAKKKVRDAEAEKTNKPKKSKSKRDERG